MEYRELGATGVMVPEVGFGTWKYRGGNDPLRRAIELGANLIDTAEIYRTEDAVGQAIAGLRDKVFVATKVSADHLRHKDVLKAADASLKRLGIETIDLYQVHWPNARIPIAETMKAMEELLDAGKVRYIGVSNFSTRQVEEAQAALKKSRIVANQVVYHLANRGVERDFDFYRRNRITVIAYSPLGEGDLLSLRRKGYDVLAAIAAETGKTVAQVALNWCLKDEQVITIPKTDRVERIDEDCGASGWRLTGEQLAKLDAAYPLR
jgi:diketogulonate reductase-like aldo/keto reductase